MSDRVKWLPYKFFKWYYIVTFFLMLFGPISYPADGFYLILASLYVLLFILVTKYGMYKGMLYKASHRANKIDDNGFIKVLKSLIVILFPIKLLLVVSSVQIYGMPSFTTLFQTLAQVYTDMNRDVGTTNIYRPIDTFMIFAFYFVLFAGVFWRKKIGKVYKSILIAETVLDLVYQLLFIGTQRSIITYIVLFFSLLMVSMARSNRKIQKNR